MSQYEGKAIVETISRQEEMSFTLNLSMSSLIDERSLEKTSLLAASEQLIAQLQSSTGLPLAPSKSLSWDYSSPAKNIPSRKFISVKQEKVGKPISSLGSTLKSMFLPVGYPHSVTADYRTYQIYDTFQAFCSSLVGLLSTRALLQGFGVGDKESSVMGALLTWTLRDGVSMLTRIVFGWLCGTSFQADVKTWRFTADLLNNLGFLMDFLAITVFPKSAFTFVASISMIFKTCTWVAGGATKAALTTHFSAWGNTADLDAKDGSQETLVNLIGMIIGSYLVRFIPVACNGNGAQSQLEGCVAPSVFSIHIWISFSVLAILHLFFNYKAISAVVLKTFNRQRAQIALNALLKSGDVLTPAQVAAKENIFHPLLFDDGVRLGVSLASLKPLEQKSLLEEIFTRDVKRSEKKRESPSDQSGREDNHEETSIVIIHKTVDSNDHLDTSSTITQVFLEDGSSQKRVLESYFAALLIQQHGFRTQREAFKFLTSSAIMTRLSEQGWKMNAMDLYVAPHEFKVKTATKEDAEEDKKTQ